MEKQSYDKLFRESLLTIRTLKKRIEEDNKRQEKIAVIGMACRFPGGSFTPEKFWDFLCTGKDSVIDIPKSRFNITDYYDAVHGRPGKMYIKQESFLTQDISEFDGKFFGISNIEANEMDPQQRLLYEVSWEALENAGLNPQGLRGSNTGVFLGISSVGEYGKLLRDSSKVNQYTGTGTTSSIASGRLSYTFGWNGPAISVDTACSSSLVSTHLAASSLLNRESDLAISAGVSLMLSPEVMSSLCSMNALSEDGRSKPFDEAANGYGRGEGCGVVVLKRLSDALRDHDIVYAVVEGSAINNDGESSNLTVPNGKAQKKVIEDAIKNAGVSVDDIDYIETHGTGTMLGDPIEFDSIREVFFSAKSRRSTALKIGAVKGSIGHLEAAAGIAGLIKVVLCLYRKKMVPIANFHKLNPRIRIDNLPVEFLTEERDWKKETGKPRMAGISSFGFSGTNAHMVLSEGVKTSEESLEITRHLLHLSAKTENGLVKIIKNYKQLFEDKEDINLNRVCYTANACREKFAHCALFAGRSIEEFLEGFHKAIEQLEKTDSIYLELVQLTGSSDGEDRLDAKRKVYQPLAPNVFTAYTDKMIQPKLVFIFHGNEGSTILRARKLSKILPSYKSRLDFYLRKICVKEKNIQDCLQYYKEGDTGMASDLLLLAVYVSMSDLLGEMGIRYEVACGTEIGDYAAAVVLKIMSFDTAVDCIISPNRESIPYRSQIHRPCSRYVSTVSASAIRDIEELYKHFNRKTREYRTAYPQTIQELYQQGYRFFLEFGESKGLKYQIQNILNRKDAIILKLLKDEDVMENFLSVAAQCITFGSKIQWGPFYEDRKTNRTVLPNYPFEKERHWITPLQKDREGFEMMPKPTEKFEAKEMILPFETRQYKFIFSNSNFQEVQDNSGVIHMGYYLEMLHNVMKKAYPDKEYTIKNIEFISAIMLLEDEVKEILIVFETGEGEIFFKMFHKNISQKSWNQNMKGTISLCADKEDEIYNLNKIKNLCNNKKLNGEEFYEPLEKEKGFNFGHAVRWVKKARIGKDSIYVKFRHMDENDIALQYNLGFHPGILDSCAQACNFLSIQYAPREKKYMVKHMGQVKIYPQHYTDDTLSAYMSFKGFDERKGEIKAEILVFNAVGEVIVRVGEIRLKEFDEKQLGMMKAVIENTNHKGGHDTAFRISFMQASMEKKKELVIEYVKTAMAEVLEEDPNQLDIHEPMDNLGLDSMSGINFYNKVTEQIGAEMPFSQLAQCKNLEELADRLSHMLQGDAAAEVQFDEMGEKDLSPQHWIYNYKEQRKAKARIFCFPNGFRSADMFENWQKQIGDDIQVCAIQIPGMDMSRISERAPVYVDEFIEALIQVLDQAELLNVPCTSFGHSWGSLFSYRLGYYLNKREGVNYQKLFVSGFTSPAIKNSSIEKILDEIRNQGFHSIPIYDDIKNDSEAVELLVKSYQKVWDYDEKGTRAVLSLLLAACGMIDRFEFNSAEKLTVPIVGFHGIDDYIVKIDEMNQWEDLTMAGFKLYTMKGDHQFVNENQSEEQLVKKIREEIENSNL